MKILGWTLRQWAIAASKYEGHAPTVTGAIDLQAQWRRTGRADPGQVVLIGVEDVVTSDGVEWTRKAIADFVAKMC
jgi:hypothetical protein